MIQFQEIGAINFLSYKELFLNIEQQKTLITGVNGAGKSTCGEVITYALYKKSRYKNPSHNGKGDCKVWVTFNKDNHLYKVERFYKDKKEKNNVKLYVDGEEVSHRKSLSTDEEIQKLIGIPYELFISSVVVMQGLPVNFSSLTPTVRKGMVEDMLGFWVFFNCSSCSKTSPLFSKISLRDLIPSRRKKLIASERLLKRPISRRSFSFDHSPSSSNRSFSPKSSSELISER